MCAKEEREGRQQRRREREKKGKKATKSQLEYIAAVSGMNLAEGMPPDPPARLAV